jgi:protein disulfide-isomerase
MIRYIKIITILVLLMFSLSACKAKNNEINENAQTEAIDDAVIPDSAKLGEWITDYQQALKMSKEYDKPILINFTGSDWCIWCKRLAKEVFDENAFSTFAEQNFVLLKLDFPKNIAQTEEVKAKNASLAEKYNVTGFPTIIILDSNEKVLGRTGYQQGGVEKYIAHLESFIKAK